MQKPHHKLRSLAVVGIIAAMSLFASKATAQSVPPLINYQGRLTDQTGAAMPPGAYIIQFRIWDSPTGGNLIWGQQQNLTIQSSGAFNVILGANTGSSIPGTTPEFTSLGSAFSGSNAFLGVSVAAGPSGVIANPAEISPRQQLLTVPFAIQAQFAQQAASLVSNLANALCPPGTVVAYMGTNTPSGWLLCDGTAINRIQYLALFGVIGTSSGAGDGATTFNLPDLRGVFLRGVNGSRSDSFADPDDLTLRTNIFPGGNIGNTVGSYQPDQFGNHVHHLIQEPAGNEFFDTDQGIVGAINWNGTESDAQTQPTGGNETRPKNAYVNYIIKY